MSTKKQHISRLVYVVGVITLVLFLGELHRVNFQISKLWPSLANELIGVGIELLVILLFFEFWQYRRNKKKTARLEHRLREYIIFFFRGTSHMLNGHSLGRFYVEDHPTNIKKLDEIKKFIETKKFSQGEQAELKKHCEIEIMAVQNLLSVASRVSDEHFKRWCRIAYFISCIYNDDSADISATLAKLIDNIKKFDVASQKEQLFYHSY